MNREQIIRMAREAGLVDNDFEPSEWCVHEYMAFAALVASAAQAKEREACAQIVESEAMQYAEPVWAFEIVNDIKARGDA
jgi:hypothetical protein